MDLSLVKLVVASVEFPPEKLAAVVSALDALLVDLKTTKSISEVMETVWKFHPKFRDSFKLMLKYVPMSSADAQFFEGILRRTDAYDKLFLPPKETWNQIEPMRKFVMASVTKVRARVSKLLVAYEAKWGELGEKTEGDIVFKVGPFVFHNERQFSPTKVKQAVKRLGEVTSRLRALGFGSVCYGAVHFVGNELQGAGHGAVQSLAWYKEDDTLSIRLDVPLDIKTWFHELGHRLWFRSKRVDQAYFKQQFDEQPSHLFPSDYAGTKVTEMFAEFFAFYCLGKLNPWQEELFRKGVRGL